MYTEQSMLDVAIAHRNSTDWSDRIALGTVRMLRREADLATGYRHNPSKRYIVNERKWMTRFIFLETVAGVPGMVGGMLRHLMSLRRMRRDNGWIESLLEEAYNERMHLLTFLSMAKPGIFMRIMVIGAQGVFFNAMFLSYLISPRTCHRFVGYLEEEAVRTYTYAIQDIEEGRLLEWEHLYAPQIAISYWRMPVGHQKMKDLLLYTSR